MPDACNVDNLRQPYVPRAEQAAVLRMLQDRTSGVAYAVSTPAHRCSTFGQGNTEELNAHADRMTGEQQ